MPSGFWKRAAAAGSRSRSDSGTCSARLPRRSADAGAARGCLAFELGFESAQQSVTELAHFGRQCIQEIREIGVLLRGGQIAVAKEYRHTSHRAGGMPSEIVAK